MSDLGRYKATLKSMTENAEAPLLSINALEHCQGKFYSSGHSQKDDTRGRPSPGARSE